MRMWMQLGHAGERFRREIDVPTLPPVGCQIFGNWSGVYEVTAVAFAEGGFFVLEVKDVSEEGPSDECEGIGDEPMPHEERLEQDGWIRGPLFDQDATADDRNINVWLQMGDGADGWCKQIEVPALPPVGCRIGGKHDGVFFVTSIIFWEREYFILNVQQVPEKEEYPGAEMPASGSIRDTLDNSWDAEGWVRGSAFDHYTSEDDGPFETFDRQPVDVPASRSN